MIGVCLPHDSVRLWTLKELSCIRLVLDGGGAGNPPLTKPPTTKGEHPCHGLRVSAGDLKIAVTNNVNCGLVFRGDGHVIIFIRVPRKASRSMTGME